MKRRFLVLLSITFVLIFLGGLCYAQEEDDGTGMIPVTINLEEEDDDEGFFDEGEDIEAEDGEDDGDFGDDETLNEIGTMEALTVTDMMFRQVVDVETFVDEDGNLVVYYYNAEGQIIEKIIYICPPKEILDEMLRLKMLKYEQAFPGFIDSLAAIGHWDHIIYKEEEVAEIEIEEVENFEFVDTYIPYDEEEEEDESSVEEDDEISVAVFDDESEEPILVSEEQGSEVIEITEEITMEEIEEEDIYLIDTTDLIPGGGQYVDTLDDKYTIYNIEQSYIEELLMRESLDYEAGRVAIVVAQDILVNWEEGTYECDFFGSYDSSHYLNGVMVTKFEVRKGMRKVITYDYATGYPIYERIHQERAGSNYDLFVYYENVDGDVGRQEIYYNGEMAYTMIPESPNTNYFFNVGLKFNANGSLKTTEEIILKDLKETINENIVTVDFSIYSIEDQGERVPYAEIGIRKTYYDNWEMISKVELYQFGGSREGEFGPDMIYGNGIAVIRYYGLNGKLWREERYDNSRLYSTIVFTYDDNGNIERISYVDVLAEVYKYKEGDSFYDAYGREISEEEFKELQPDYAVNKETDDFYANLLKEIDIYEEDIVEEDVDEEPIGEEDEIEEGFMEEDEGDNNEEADDSDDNGDSSSSEEETNNDE